MTGGADHPPELLPQNQVVVLFGATGDLSQRKLLPGLFHLSEAGLLPERFRIIGTSRGALTDDDFRATARAAVDRYARRTPTISAWRAFAETLSYVEAGDDEGLAAAVAAARDALGDDAHVLHYLAVPPAASAGIVTSLGLSGLNQGARIVLEKPFGHDLDSAVALNRSVHEVFDESQVFRIDHFLGKETVQNILALRFANPVFERVWGAEFVDSVQIDVPETLSIEHRAVFYEETGAFRDMVVTHLLQVLGFVAMEPPESFDADGLVDETCRVFDALAPIRPEDVVRGQYTGYTDEDGVAAESQTETFVAARTFVENERWDGVPFYLRTGKMLAEGRRVVTLVFRRPTAGVFGSEQEFPPRELVLDLGEPGSVTTRFLVKVPGAAMELGAAPFAFHYEDSFQIANQLEAYERLIHDAMVGDHTLFTRADGIERLWGASAPVLADPPLVEPYSPGSWGPDAMHDLIAPGCWHLPAGESGSG